MSTSDASTPHNRVNFDPGSETYVNQFYKAMQENNLTLSAITTYLRTTNTSQANFIEESGALNESMIKIVKKLRDENVEVTEKWAAYMALRGGVIQNNDLSKPDNDYQDLATVLESIMKIYKDQANFLRNNLYNAGIQTSDGHLLHFSNINLVYNHKKLYQVVKAMQINARTNSGLGDYIFSNALDLEDQERDIFDFSNVI